MVLDITVARDTVTAPVKVSNVTGDVAAGKIEKELALHAERLDV